MVRKHLDTINEFARQGYKLRFTCGACGRVTDASAVQMIIELHRRKLSLQTDAVELRAKCSKCGERQARIGPIEPEC